MVDLILKAMVPAVLDKLRKAGPGYITALLSWLSKTVPASIDTVTAWFRESYASVTGRIATWAALPATAVGLATRFDKALTWAQKQVDKK